jgi:hypothetical protein
MLSPYLCQSYGLYPCYTHWGDISQNKKIVSANTISLFSTATRDVAPPHLHASLYSL